MNLLNHEYREWINNVKSHIRARQILAARVANKILIQFYWELGKMISEKQTGYGSKFLEQMSKDLRDEFPNMQGFSVTNLKYCRLFFNYLDIRPQDGDELGALIRPQDGDEFKESEVNPTYKEFFEIPWGHVKEILSKTKDINIGLFYVCKTLENSWSRDVLSLQLKSNLHERQGRAVNNFKKTLPEPFSDLAQQTLKDPYVLDFMTLTQPFNERDIENQLIIHIRKFLLELGKGFAFVGQQYEIQIADEDYRIDLLFYHIKLKCYVVIDLKNVKFTPESAGKMNFYLSAIDTILKGEDDKPTIGIILCREKNNVIAEFALRDLNKPIGVTEFQLVNELPENLKPSLPTIEELENELKDIQ